MGVEEENLLDDDEYGDVNDDLRYGWEMSAAQADELLFFGSGVSAAEIPRDNRKRDQDE